MLFILCDDTLFWFCLVNQHITLCKQDDNVHVPACRLREIVPRVGRHDAFLGVNFLGGKILEGKKWKNKKNTINV